MVVSAERDPTSGDLSPLAKEINVTAGNPPGRVRQLRPAPANKAKLRGIFQGIDPVTGDFLLGDVAVAMDGETEIEGALVAGDAVEIEAELLPDGSMILRNVEQEDPDADITEKTRLSGEFQGIDAATGQWMVGGARVTVNRSTDTDGMPAIGQQVSVTAFLQRDGLLLAREIENRNGRIGLEDEDQETKLEGTFLGADAAGDWIIGGRRVSVDANTAVLGNPSVGERVAVQAMPGEGGRLIARSVKARNTKAPKRQATVRGTVERVLNDGSLIVNGIRVDLSDLTDQITHAAPGDDVAVQALLQDNGSLVAIEIESGPEEVQPGLGPQPAADPVEIQGEIENIGPDGSFTLNGLRVVVSALSEVEGELTPGASIRVRGQLQNDGSVLVRELRVKDRLSLNADSEVKLEGVVESVFLASSGDLQELVVNGVAVSVDALTKSETTVKVGSLVEIKAVFKDGRFLAVKIEAAGPGDSKKQSLLEVLGTIESIRRDDFGRVASVTVDGVDIAVSPDSELLGRVAVGESVALKGAIEDGTFVAAIVETAQPKQAKPRPTKFEIKGHLEQIEQDQTGRVTELVVDGEHIQVEALTILDDDLAPGDDVEVEGVVQDNTLLGGSITREGDDSGDDSSEAASKGQQGSLPEAAVQAREQTREKAAEAREKAKSDKEQGGILGPE